MANIFVSLYYLLKLNISFGCYLMYWFIDWLILTAYQHIQGYIMHWSYEIVFIVRSFLHFVSSWF